ncbi:carbohydrate ABC transporter permease [Paenibacillus sp. GCM10027626]|uniref:carbohydrate ABC transporter permease n=1 Tax=Paenibacillus sp. GCM10027626 TaxID=3273411 RepID=UPI00362ED90F
MLQSGIWSIVRMVMIVGICFAIIYPILVKISVSLKSRSDIFDPTVVWIPRNITLDNIRVVIDHMSYWVSLLNSVVLSSTTTVLQVASCALAGYAFARLKFKGSGILFTFVIFTIMIPPQTIMIPNYLNYRFFDFFGLIGWLTGSKGINLLDSYWPFILSSALAMGLKNGLYIFIFRQFFRSLPKEIEEAAYVDGAGAFKTFYRVMLPNAVPAAITVLLFSFVWQWNDIFYVSQYLSSTKVLSLQLVIMPNSIRWITMDPLYSSILTNAGALLVMLPLIIMYFFVQRYFVEGVERTGLVG